MPEPVGLDTAALRALTDRVARCAAALSAVPIGGVRGLAGSALAASQAPGRATADVQRHAATVSRWAEAARRCTDELTTAEQVHAERLR